MTRCSVLLVLCAAAACGGDLVPMETCIERDRDVGLEVLNVSGPVVDGTDFTPAQPCFVALEHSLVVADVGGDRFRFSWGREGSDLAVALADGAVDVDVRAGIFSFSLVIEDSEGVAAAFNPGSETSAPELDGVRVTRGDWISSTPQTCGVTDQTNLAVTVGDERITVGPGRTAPVVVDGRAFTFHAFGAATESFSHCEDGSDLFSWALVRDAT